jgi:hypothetical protein
MVRQADEEVVRGIRTELKELEIIAKSIGSVSCFFFFPPTLPPSLPFGHSSGEQVIQLLNLLASLVSCVGEAE